MVALLALVGPAEASPGTLLDEQRKLQVRESRDQETGGERRGAGQEVKQAEADIAGLSPGLESSEQPRQQLEGVGKEGAQLKDELLSFHHLLERVNVALAQAQHKSDAARAETEAHRNSGLRPCGYGLRWVPDLSQTASHRSR
jgi:hypothetical protein